MSLFRPAGVPADQIKDRSPVPREFELFARIEGLVGEEIALLEMAEEDRKREHHERLRAISAELDRIWDRLRERAERLGREHERDDAGSC